MWQICTLLKIGTLIKSTNSTHCLFCSQYDHTNIPKLNSTSNSQSFSFINKLLFICAGWVKRSSNLILSHHSPDIFLSNPTEIIESVQQFGHHMQIKMRKNKAQVENTTKDPLGTKIKENCSSTFPHWFSLCTAWLYTICICQVLLCLFFWHFSSPIFSVFLCYTLSLLSVKPKWLCLTAFLLSISFPYSSLHPALLLSPSQLALGLYPGGLFALKDHDGLHYCLQQCWGTAMALDLCHVLFIQRLQSKWERSESRWTDDDSVCSNSCWATF